MSKLTTPLICISAAITLLINSCSTTAPEPTTAPGQITTSIVSKVTITTALTGGKILNDGGSTITSKGVVWSISEGPTIELGTKTNDGSGNSNFESNVSGLNMNTTYFVRAYATNKVGTSYGNELTFKTGLLDVDGNLYKTVQIGTKIWMAENLNTSKYNTGENIPNVTSDALGWGALSSGAWCYYNNSPLLSTPYGKLYNWYAVQDPRKLCPTGWHVPSDDDWTILSDYLGGQNMAGGKIKITSTSYWNPPNSGATNESGFNGYPGGYRAYDVNFSHLGTSGYWWSSSESDPNNAWLRGAVYDVTDLFRYGNGIKSDGFSVRCVKD